jgi:ABC-type sugar transport system ATPase subunit
MSSIHVRDVTLVFDRLDPLGDALRRRREANLAPEMAPPEPDEATASAARRTVALDHCNLQVADGETVAIVGPSGCGKSTLLRVVAGLLHPQSGQVLYDGVDMADVPPKDRGIGMVFQNYALYPHWESRENLGFFFRLRKREQEIPERVRITADIMGVGFDQLLARKPPTLSGGQQQRVAIARCIVRDPKLFLFDEPLSNLDAKLRTQTRIEIKRLLRRFAITALYVTHDQTEALALADRIAIMRQGQVDQIGTYAEIYERPANTHVAGFMGSPPMNLVPMRVTEGHLRTEGLELPLPANWAAVLLTGQQVVLGIRPEHLRVEPAGPLHTVVDLVEPVLSQRVQHVYFMFAGRRLVARLPEELRLAVGDPLSLAMPNPRSTFSTMRAGSACPTRRADRAGLRLLPRGLLRSLASFVSPRSHGAQHRQRSSDWSGVNVRPW